jgi:hypothetical protein
MKWTDINPGEKIFDSNNTTPAFDNLQLWIFILLGNFLCSDPRTELVSKVISFL